MNTSDLIFGKTWDEIQALQRKERIRPINMQQTGDYGSDPTGDGKFRMVPSGDIVTLEERNARLAKRI